MLMDQETIKRFIEEAHGNAVERGFYDCPVCNGDCFTIEGGAEIGYDAEGNEIQIDGRYQSQCKKCNGTGIDQNKNIGELLMLIVSELGKALEAHRCGRFNNYIFPDHFSEKTFNSSHFETFIKDTREDKIADVFIRLFDLCGYLEIDARIDYNSFVFPTENVGESFLFIVSNVLSIWNDREEMRDININFVIGCLFRFCQKNHIPIQKHIEAKMAYNRTRPQKHWKAY